MRRARDLPTQAAFRVYISGQYWPTNVAFKEPSRLTNEEATTILEWWRDRQVTDPTDTFRFKRWLESDGSVQSAVAQSHSSSAKRRVKGHRKGNNNVIKWEITKA